MSQTSYSQTSFEMTGFDRPFRGGPQPNVGQSERLISVTAGALIALWALDRRPLWALTGLAVGGSLLYRGLTGHCSVYQSLGLNSAENGGRREQPPAIPAQQGERVECRITIAAAPDVLFRRWRKLSDLPQIMSHLDSVEELDERRSRWTVEGPLGIPLEWEAEILNERPNELISWRSLPGGSLDTAGSVRFEKGALENTTEVVVNMKYDPPAGKLGVWAAGALGSGLKRQLDEDLQKFKDHVEGTSLPLPTTK
ncbi:MAG: SRPBCC family protein [Pirellulaceae bacterium]